MANLFDEFSLAMDQIVCSTQKPRQINNCLLFFFYSKTCPGLRFRAYVAVTRPVPMTTYVFLKIYIIKKDETPFRICLHSLKIATRLSLTHFDLRNFSQLFLTKRQTSNIWLKKATRTTKVRCIIKK